MSLAHRNLTVINEVALGLSFDYDIGLEQRLNQRAQALVSQPLDSCSLLSLQSLDSPRQFMAGEKCLHEQFVLL